MKNEIEKRTKEIYIEQHKNYLLDNDLFDRFYEWAMETRNYGVSKDFIRGKKY